MDELAVNYNPDANWDDSSCEYPEPIDYSLSFDGSGDDLLITDFHPPSGTQQRTITFWAKYMLNDDVCETGTGSGILNYGGTQSNGCDGNKIDIEVGC